MLYYCYHVADNSQGILSRIVISNRVVRMTPASKGDLQMLIPRRESRAEAERHVLKLQWWSHGHSHAIDLPVHSMPGTEFFEVCVTDSFGFGGGLRFILWEDVLYPPDGQIWIIGVRRDDELLSDRLIQILHQRKEMIFESGEQFEAFSC